MLTEFRMPMMTCCRLDSSREVIWCSRFMQPNQETEDLMSEDSSNFQEFYDDGKKWKYWPCLKNYQMVFKNKMAYNIWSEG